MQFHPRSLRFALPALLALLLVAPHTTRAQGYWYYVTGAEEPNWIIEAGVTAGIMNGVTDLQGNPKVYQGPFAGVTFRKSNFTWGLYAIGTYKDKVGIRLEFNKGEIEGYDSLLTNATAPSAIGRFERNLNFRSPITELSVVTEWHVTQIFRSYEKPPNRLSPYILAGLSWFKFEPQAYTSNGWVDLRPLRLEGQGFAEYPDRKPYRGSSFSYPIGIGFRYALSPRFTLRFEANKRTAFTDYIDDTHEGDWVDPSLFANYLAPDQAELARFLYNRSNIHTPPRDTRPRGHPNENDAYWTMTFKVGINLNRPNDANGLGREGRRMLRNLRCPSY